ncbi:polysaccharide pyruvyl transferase family protein, partial [Candidatus Ruminimicrobium bovinum]|uniref:polysaccharide pyruvyl transferase family protein n=1 Tax=Candidatus Ruminimicrobium bovinum TaxID=3242779 RepID=UPI0039B9CE3F
IVINAAKYNMGSNMLLRGIVQIVKNTDVEFIAISSADISQKESLNIPFVNKYIPRKSKWIKNYFIRKIFTVAYKIFGINLFLEKTKNYSLYNEFKNFDLIVLVAADNYDYNKKKNPLDEMISYISKLRNKPKIILYDFSINKENITQYLKESIKKVDFLTTRDSLSFENLNEIKETKNKLFLTHDPAFVVKPKKIEINIDWTKNYVGLNISSMVLNKNENVLDTYYKLIEQILSYKYLNILLIPHVMKQQDLKGLKILYEKYKNTGRVFLIDNENFTGPQLKYIISKCRFFVGARTHATIAAYSSCVPTLVLGYSIKSLGIAKDLFGTYEKYVVKLDEISNNKNLLADSFKWIYENEENIKKHLISVMPKYIENASSVGKIIKDILN